LLNQKKLHLNLRGGEVKWSKVTDRYVEKYIELIQDFFALVKSRELKVRIMFRQNAYELDQLTQEDLDTRYFKLYYQFVKHAFALESASLQKPTKLRWTEPYLHWNYIPKFHVYKEELTKSKKKKPQIAYTNTDA
jgi:hypothetical protein